MKNIITVLILAVSLLSTQVFADARFWKRVDRDLAKQSKQIKKDLKKRDLSELYIRFTQLKTHNKIAKKYNIVSESSVSDINSRPQYAYYANDIYASRIKQTIELKAKEFASFQDYMETTGEGRKARSCRTKRQVLLVGSVTLLSMAIAGGITIGMLVPNVLAGTAITIRPVAAALLVMFGVGTPSGATSMWLAQKMRCLGE